MPRVCWMKNYYVIDGDNNTSHVRDALGWRDGAESECLIDTQALLVCRLTAIEQLQDCARPHIFMERRTRPSDFMVAIEDSAIANKIKIIHVDFDARKPSATDEHRSWL